jgi:parallel beta-helix repeat protein
LGRKAVSGVMLALLLLSALTMVVIVQPVKATGTIYIRADGSVDPPIAPIQRDGDTYTLTGNITSDSGVDGIIIERNNMTLDGSGFTVQGTGLIGITLTGRSNVTIESIEIKAFYGGGIYFVGGSNITIIRSTLTMGSWGISFTSSSDITISETKIEQNSRVGIEMYSSSFNTISENEISYSKVGVYIRDSSNDNTVSGNTISGCSVRGLGIMGSNNTVCGNVITQNDCGVDGGAFNTFFCNDISSNDYNLVLSSNNTVFGNNISDAMSFGISAGSYNKIIHNNFANNLFQIGGAGSSNVWDDGYPSGGNYWSDYAGEDSYKGPYQNETGSDGMGDTPNLLAPGNIDNYPFMNSLPWEFDTAVMRLLPSKTVASHGSVIPINVTVKNEGSQSATFKLTVESTTVYIPMKRRHILQANAAQGWNNSIPGPSLTAILGDTIELKLEATDTLHHKFYVDYNGNAFPDSNEPQSPSFINSALTYSFTTDKVGTFTYYCAYHQETEYGSLIVNPIPPPESTVIGSQNVALASNEEKNITFTWDTGDFAKDSYVVSAYAQPVVGEVDKADNTYNDGTVIVMFIGDISRDGKVDSSDLLDFSDAYGSMLSAPSWNPYCDSHNDNKIDVSDLLDLGKNYGKTDP